MEPPTGGESAARSAMGFAKYNETPSGLKPSGVEWVNAQITAMNHGGYLNITTITKRMEHIPLKKAVDYDQRLVQRNGIQVKNLCVSTWIRFQLQNPWNHHRNANVALPNSLNACHGGHRDCLAKIQLIRTHQVQYGTMHYNFTVSS